MSAHLASQPSPTLVHALPEAGSSSPHAQPSSHGNSRGGHLLLADEGDAEWLTDVLCFVRCQIEFFPAAAEDIKARNQRGGLKQPLAEGRVGIRCIHCAHVPIKQRANGAILYPKSIRLVYQAVRNWQRYHMLSCPYIADELKARYKGFKRQHSGNDVINYWIDSCKRKGLIDGPEEGILFEESFHAHEETQDVNTAPAHVTRSSSSHESAPTVLTNSNPESGTDMKAGSQGNTAEESFVALMASPPFSLVQNNTLNARAKSDELDAFLGGGGNSHMNQAGSMKRSQKGTFIADPSSRQMGDAAGIPGNSISVKRGNNEIFGNRIPSFAKGTAENIRFQDGGPLTEKGEEYAEPSELESAHNQPLDGIGSNIFTETSNDNFEELNALFDSVTGQNGAALYNCSFNRAAITNASTGVSSIMHTIEPQLLENPLDHIQTKNTVTKTKEIESEDERELLLESSRLDSASELVKTFSDDGITTAVSEANASIPTTNELLQEFSISETTDFLKLRVYEPTIDGPALGAEESKRPVCNYEGDVNSSNSLQGCDQPEPEAASTCGSSTDCSQMNGLLTWFDNDMASRKPFLAEREIKCSQDSDDLLESLKLSDTATSVVGLAGNGEVSATLSELSGLGSFPPISHKSKMPAQHEELDFRGIGDEGNVGATDVIQEPTVTALTAAEPETTSPENVMEQRVLGKVHLALDAIPPLAKIRPVSNASLGQEANHLATTIKGKIDSSSLSSLYSLGVKLYELFAEHHPFINANDSVASISGEASQDLSIKHVPQRKKQDNLSTIKAYTPLRELGFPTALCVLVSSLLDVKDGGCDCPYQSSDEVREELRLMGAEPHRFLFDQDLCDMNGQLKIPCGILYGRETQVSSLMSAYDRVIVSGGPCEMFLASGYSGTGKTSLMLQVQGSLAERGGYFITGKFDELHQAEPYSAIVAAFNEYCDALVTRDAETLQEIRTAIRDAVGDDADVLTALIPHLCNVIGKPEMPPLMIKGKEAHNRLLFFFRKFLRAISNPFHPIVLFLDDLQWADEMSLELIRSLVTDKQITSFLLLGCYRENEVSLDHPLTQQLRAIKNSGINITTITVNNITNESVNALISDTLHMSPLVTKSLAEVVFNKTSGNAFFVIQFLKSLHDEGLLFFSLVWRRWKWDVEAIRSKNIADNMVELMTCKMRRLAPKVLWGLQMASCLGIQCNESALKYLDIGDDLQLRSLSPLLDECIGEGLIIKVGTSYKFSHDQIRLAAYSLIPADVRQSWHLSIGRLLRDHSSDEEMNSIIFLVVDQFQRGAELITDHTEQVQFAGLCLKAGKKAMQSSAFTSASIHLLQGTTLLDGRDWEDRYDLTLELFTCCAEAQYCCEDYDGVGITLNPVFLNSKCLQDSFRAHLTLLNSLGSKGRPLDAIKYGLNIFAGLGETFPSDINQGVIMMEVAKTRAALETYTTDSIFEIPLMQDKRKLAAVKLMARVYSYSFLVKQELAPLLVCRMVRLSLSHGLNSKTPIALACFAAILSGSAAGLERAYRYGKLAISLVERLDARKDTATTNFLVYGQTNIFKEPLQACVEKLDQVFESAISVGEVDLAIMSFTTYSIMGFQSGRNLQAWSDRVGAKMEQMECFHSRYLDNVTLIYSQAVSNLIGSSKASKDPTALCGGFMNQDDVMNQAHEKKNAPHILMNHICFVRMLLAFIFGRYDVAGEMVERRRALNRSHKMRPNTVVNEAFYSGLIAATLARARTDNEAQWRVIAQESLEKLEAWTVHSEWNCQHKFEATKAEIAYLDGDLDAAAQAYDAAIKSALRHGFINEQALICERAGVFYSETMNYVIANDYFIRACDYYSQWGAKRKASDLLALVENK